MKKFIKKMWDKAKQLYSKIKNWQPSAETRLCVFVMIVVVLLLAAGFAIGMLTMAAIKADGPACVNTETIVESTAQVPEVEIPSEPDPLSTVLDPSYENAAIYLAKTVYGEARGCTTTEKAGVIWCILNRVDLRSTQTANDIIAVITAPYQFHGYSPYNPIREDIYSLSIDVLKRWMAEKNGVKSSGRVLPREYLYFSGDGRHNYFRTKYRGGVTWNWGWGSVYAD